MRRPQNLKKISLLFRRLLSKSADLSKQEGDFQIFVAFSEKLNFNFEVARRQQIMYYFISYYTIPNCLSRLTILNCSTKHNLETGALYFDWFSVFAGKNGLAIVKIKCPCFKFVVACTYFVDN